MAHTQPPANLGNRIIFRRTSWRGTAMYLELVPETARIFKVVTRGWMRRREYYNHTYGGATLEGALRWLRLHDYEQIAPKWLVVDQGL